MKRINEEKLSQMAKYIKIYVQNNGKAPQFEMILKYMGMSKSVGYRYIMRLKDRGVIEYNGRGTLNIKNAYTPGLSTRQVAIMGNIICGLPRTEEEYTEGYISLPEQWVQGECYLLRANGDSMVDVGIEENDLLLIKKTDSPIEGQIVVALTEDGNTLKRLKYQNGRPVLIAENAKYKKTDRVIYPKVLEVQGVVLKLIKDFMKGER